MTVINPAPPADQSSRPEVAAALLVLERMGLSPADLLSVPPDRPAVPTFAEYVPVVAQAVTAGTRRAYGSYWNRVIDHWGGPPVIRMPHSRLDSMARLVRLALPTSAIRSSITMIFACMAEPARHRRGGTAHREQ